MGVYRTPPRVLVLSSASADTDAISLIKLIQRFQDKAISFRRESTLNIRLSACATCLAELADPEAEQGF